MSEKLIKWRNKLIHQIEDHVVEQSKLLDQYVENEKHHIDARCKQLLVDVALQDKKNNKEQIKRLVAECKTLQFDLAQFHRYNYPTKFIRFSIKEQLVAEQQDNENVRKSRRSQSQRRIVTDDRMNDIHNSRKDTPQNSLTELSYLSFKHPRLIPSTHVTLPEIKHATTDIKSSNSHTVHRDDVMDRRIDAWEETQLQNIRQHASYQKQLLNEEYENECNDLKEQRQEFIETLFIHEAQKNTEQINRLIDCCKALQCELAPLIYNEQPTQFIHLTK
ncbi:unnamed protein product [Rotaria magnacalcarata]|uniref:Uncharacterized protein n=1 Tax=Rotaria magnacalcarata TaxID=392030 RepID=A0A820FH80_9BILA|nr:unnamed protein product [Rotaria magnacalcarata]CAF4264616.1 unnamed protein product [Rotaria magnacalcarata]